MPIYNSKDNDILTALEETYRSMVAEAPVAPGRPQGGKMGRDDKDYDEQKGPSRSGDDAGAPDPRTPEQKAEASKENKALASRGKAADPAKKADEAALKKALGPAGYAKYLAKKNQK